MTRDVTCEHLAELARAYGYTEGPALGVTVAVEPETGEVKGGTMTVFGAGNPVVYISKPEGISARKLWQKADRDLNLLVEIRVSYSIFSQSGKYIYILRPHELVLT